MTTSHSRRRLIEALLEELGAWNPRESIAAVRRWHQGSFSLIHLNVLAILEIDGASSMGQLAAALDVSVASMTGIVDRMEKRGLVARRRDAADRRIVLVHPTDAGRDVFREIDRRRREGLEKMLVQLGDKELAGLLAGHRALRLVRTSPHVGEGAEAVPTPAASGATPPPGIHGTSMNPAEDEPVTPTEERPS